MGAFDDLLAIPQPSAPGATPAAPPAPTVGSTQSPNAFADLMQQPAAAPAPGSVEDYLRTIPAAADRGVSGLLGTPANILSGGAQLYGWLHGPHDETRPLGALLNRIYADDDRAQVKKAVESVRSAVEPATSAGLLRRLESQPGEGPLYQPQGIGPKLLGAGVEGAVGAPMMPGGPLMKLAQAALPAVASEAAGIATQGTPLEIPARILAAGATTVPLSLAAVPRGAQGLTSDALRVANVTGDEINQAYGLMQSARQRPNPIDLPFDEAINQVTGGRVARLSQLRRVVEQSGTEGAQPFQDIRSARPEQVQQAGEAAIGGIAPTPVPASMTAQRGLEAAEAALQDLRNRRTEGWQRVAQGLPEHVDPADIGRFAQQVDAQIIANGNNPELVAGLRDLRSRLTAQEAVPAVPGTPATRTPVTDAQGNVIRYQTTPATPGTPAVPAQLETGVDPLNVSRMAIRDAYTGGTGQLTPTERTAERLTNTQLGNLSTMLEQASPNFARAQDLYGRVTERMVTPATQGPLGRITRTAPEGEGASAAMGRTLAGVGEGPRYADVVSQATRRMVREDPQAAQTLIRDYVGSVFDKATSDLQAGANQMGGANFRKALIGSDANAANLEAAVRQLPQGAQVWRGFQNLLDIFEATGYAPQVGSRTAFNVADLKALQGKTGILGTAIDQAKQGGLGVKALLSDKVAQYRLGQNTGELANLLTDPAAAPLMRQLAEAPSGSGKALAIAARLIGLGPGLARSSQGYNRPTPAAEESGPLQLTIRPGYASP